MDTRKSDAIYEILLQKKASPKVCAGRLHTNI